MIFLKYKSNRSKKIQTEQLDPNWFERFCVGWCFFSHSYFLPGFSAKGVPLHFKSSIVFANAISQLMISIWSFCTKISILLSTSHIISHCTPTPLTFTVNSSHHLDFSDWSTANFSVAGVNYFSVKKKKRKDNCISFPL